MSFSKPPTIPPLVPVIPRSVGPMTRGAAVLAATLGLGCIDEQKQPDAADASDTSDFIAPQPPPQDTENLEDTAADAAPDFIAPQPPPRDTEPDFIPPQPPPQDTESLEDADAEPDFIPPQPPPQDTESLDDGADGDAGPDVVPPQPPPQPPPDER